MPGTDGRSSPAGTPRNTRPPPPRRDRNRPVLAGGLLVLSALAAVGDLAGQDRLVHRFDARHGLTTSTVLSLAQDPTGFVWIGTVGGLYRYDGSEVRRWAPDRIRGRVDRVVAEPGGGVLATEQRGKLWRVAGDGSAPVAGPDGDLRDVEDLAHDGRGSLWVLRDDGRLARRGSDGRWREVELPDEAGREDPRYLFRRGPEAVDLATRRGLWTVTREGGAERVADLDRIVDVLSLPDDRRVVVTFWRDAYLVGDGAPRKVANPPGRGIDAVRRGEAVWIGYDRFLVRLGPDGEAEVLGPEQVAEAGGPLLVDHEGSLWTGSQAGLVQFPEPETLVWADPQGLPSAHTRFVARAGDSVWVSTWQGVGRVVRDGSGWRAASTSGWTSRSQVVVDDEGDVWVGTTDGLLELRAGRRPAVHAADFTTLRTVARGEGDALWLGGFGGLYRVDTGGFGPDGRSGPRRGRGLDVPDDVVVTAAHRDDEGRLWAGVGERICRIHADSALAAPDPRWRCWTIPGAVHFTSLHQTDAGAVWAASPYLGVLRLREGRWETIPASRELPSRSVLNLVPSPSGGVWIVGHGILQRVDPRPDAPDGWEVLERLTFWHGVPAAGGEDVLEDPDGTVWVTTSRGLARVPARVRRRSPRPPRVVLVEARVDDEGLDPTRPVRLPHDRNRLELRFAALSFRAPSVVRYQVRLLPGSSWSDAGGQPVVRWVDLAAGSYRAEVRASLDGETWTRRPASFGFEVAPPWYREPRWIAAFGLVGLLVVLLLYRARVAHLLGLERQRTRIAMDLHDELGAALGSIGIQAGMMKRPGVAEPQRRRLAGEISETAEALGTTVADIVWSLDPRAATLADLALRLEERGRRLFDERETEFEVRFPRRWPSEDLPASVRRNALLVGLEALQNAAAHAGADRVVLSLAPVRPGLWRLAVRDDGRGIPPAAHEEGGGMGLLSMRKRAEEMGADIVWRRPEGGGTEVVLSFPLRGRRSPWGRVRAWWSRR